MRTSEISRKNGPTGIGGPSRHVLSEFNDVAPATILSANILPGNELCQYDCALSFVTALRLWSITNGV